MKRHSLMKAYLVVLLFALCAAGATAAPVANFTASPTTGIAPLAVQFTDLSTFNGTAVVWQWQFGDGSPNSTVQNPLYMYPAPGVYTVNLTVRDLEGVNTMSQVNLITATYGVTFTAIPQTGFAPQNVTFQDASVGSNGGPIIFWDYQFGDGSPNVSGTSSVVSHIYTAPGTYTANLTITDQLTLQATGSIDITVQDNPFAVTQTVVYTSPNTNHTGVRVLVYSDQNRTYANGTMMPIADNQAPLVALKNLNFSYTGTNNHTVFYDYLQNQGPWNLVIYNEEMWDPPGSNPMTRVANYTPLTTYITGGGRAIVTTANMEIYPTDPLWTALGVVLPNRVTDPLYQEKINGTNGSAYFWNTAFINNSFGLFVTPNIITSPILYNGSALQYDINGYNITTNAGGWVALGNTTLPAFGKGHISVTNSNRTIFNGLIPGSMINQRAKRIDVELFENEILVVQKFTKIGTMRNHRLYFDRSGNGVFGLGDISFGLGVTGDVGVSGDWSGTGKTRVGVFRPSTRFWYLDRNGDFLADQTVNGFLTNITNALPVTGDWTGNGTTKIGVVNNTTKMWYLDLNKNFVFDAGDVNFTLTGYTSAVNDTPVTGNWNGTAITSYGMYRGGQWFLDTNGDRVVDLTYPNFLTNATYMNVTGDWTGNGTTKVGLSRNGQWWLDANKNGVFDPAGDIYYANFLTNLTTGTLRNVTGNW
ncbi:MAG: PKD domain-containing protein [Methanoregulaceae archaeon]|nr:PKD domain-containing protein [Methanoregulaceae archaeon]